MDIIVASTGANAIGRRGENGSTRLLFPIAQWKKLYGADGTFQLIAQRYGDAGPYPVAIETDDNYVYWTISSSDTAIAGDGRCELSYYVGEVLAKSAIYKTLVYESLDEPGSEVPAPYLSWVEQVQQTAVDAAASASVADSSAEDAEAYASGKRGGVDVGSSDPAYNNYSKYYAEQSATSASDSENSAEDAEAYAIGKRDGVDVGSSDPAYHNNSKYYSEQSADAAAAAAASLAEKTDLTVIAAEDTSPTTFAHPAGTYFICNGKLYKATSYISPGTTVPEQGSSTLVIVSVTDVIKSSKAVFVYMSNSADTIYSVLSAAPSSVPIILCELYSENVDTVTIYYTLTQRRQGYQSGYYSSDIYTFVATYRNSTRVFELSHYYYFNQGYETNSKIGPTSTLLQERMNVGSIAQGASAQLSLPANYRGILYCFSGNEAARGLILVSTTSSGKSAYYSSIGFGAQSEVGVAWSNTNHVLTVTNNSQTSNALNLVVTTMSDVAPTIVTS